MFSLQNKTALITGAGSGIGKAIALTFARQGAHVEVLDLSLDAATQAVDEIKAAGGSAAASACDISNTKVATEHIAGILARHKRLDILVNNAGIAHIGTALTTTDEDLDRLYNVNVKACTTPPSLCSHAWPSRAEESFSTCAPSPP